MADVEENAVTLHYNSSSAVLTSGKPVRDYILVARLIVTGWSGYNNKHSVR